MQWVLRTFGPRSKYPSTKFRRWLLRAVIPATIMSLEESEKSLKPSIHRASTTKFGNQPTKKKKKNTDQDKIGF